MASGWRTTTLALLLASSTSCSGGETESEGPADDGKFHPDPNGVRLSETEACDTVKAALQDRALALGCATTIRACPNFLRVHYQPDCMEYDQGTVQGCAAYFAALSECSELVDDSCVLEPFPGSEPSGCP